MNNYRNIAQDRDREMEALEAEKQAKIAANLESNDHEGEVMVETAE